MLEGILSWPTKLYPEENHCKKGLSLERNTLLKR